MYVGKTFSYAPSLNVLAFRNKMAQKRISKCVIILSMSRALMSASQTSHSFSFVTAFLYLRIQSLTAPPSMAMQRASLTRCHNKKKYTYSTFIVK